MNLEQINYKEYGALTYQEYAKCEGYSISRELLLDADKNQLQEFKAGLITERKKYITCPKQEHEEIFWAVMDEMSVATSLNM